MSLAKHHEVGLGTGSNIILSPTSTFLRDNPSRAIISKCLSDLGQFSAYFSGGLSTRFDDYASTTAHHIPGFASFGKRPCKLTQQQQERLQESRRAASAQYRERNREQVLEARRLRAARQRAQLKDDEEVKVRTREASARYRASHCDELALKQRKVRKKAFIHKHEPQEKDDAESDNDADVSQDDSGTGSSYSAPLICDYYDPFLKRH
ncbi:hypothetical protein C8R44DRAFT_886071 [Mycena epipterygia]|nr:hypothetical protein C8R44DRAFT_886071 [Mycena epipterygia]